MHENEPDVSQRLVRQLVDTQFPAYASQPLTLVEPWGTDNAIWRLGEDHVVRLPRIDWAVNQIELEHTWLPQLSPHLSVAIPEPIAVGKPDFGYPFPWAIHRWVPGEGAAPERIADRCAFAQALATAVAELQAVPAANAPPARNRARPVQEYDEQTRTIIEQAKHVLDADAATAIWDEAIAAEPHAGPPVWVHGDLEGNCLVKDGALHGLIDWGSACAGDPAVEIHVAWSPLLTGDASDAFLTALDVDDATIARAKGAAVQQAAAALPYYLDTYPLIVQRARHKLTRLGVPLRGRGLG